jgi:hypothetical protein
MSSLEFFITKERKEEKQKKCEQGDPKRKKKSRGVSF